MEKKSIVLLLIALGVIAVLVAYAAGSFNWILTYSREAEGDQLNSLRRTVGIIALLAYAYFGIRFFNRCVSEQV